VSPDNDILERIAERLVDLVETEAGGHAFVCDCDGRVVCASDARRIGDLDPSAARLATGGVEEIVTTAEQAGAAPGRRGAVVRVVMAAGLRLCALGVEGPVALARPVARLAVLVAQGWAAEQLQAEVAVVPAEGRRPRLLCIDGSEEFRTRVQALLGRDHEVSLAGDAAAGIDAARGYPPDAVLCARDLPRGSGLKVLLAIKGVPSLQAVPVIVVTDEVYQATPELVEAGAHDFLPRAASDSGLRARVEAAASYYTAQQQVRAERGELARMTTVIAKNVSRTRAIVETAGDAIFLLGPRGRIEGLNAAAERMFGHPRREAEGRSFLEDFVAPASRPALEERWRLRTRGAPPPAARAPADLHGLRRSGEEFPVECTFTQLGPSAASGSCAYVRDLTEARQRELELRQSQKLEAVGRLAAGIAHEINTPIQFVGDNTRFLEQAFAAMEGLLRRSVQAVRPEALEEFRRAEEEADLGYLREQVPETIRSTLHGIQRVASIVRAMRDFAHPDQREMAAADLNRAIQATLEVARNEYKYVADLVTDLADLPLVTCHAGDLNQVVLNIVVNAAHAIGDANKGTQARGTIRVATRAEGEQVVIRIGDDGPGIRPAIRDRVFEPFFTTKEVGRGTGQGLAIARSIVTKHGGTIAFDSELGKGTTFVIRLPVVQPGGAA
jgi:PAS domain S-box-containing protein